MADTVEATGRTLEDAKRQAAEALGVSVEDCEFEVVEQAAKGLFAKTNVRVRATLKPQGKPTKAVVGTAPKKAAASKKEEPEPAAEEPEHEQPEEEGPEVEATEDDSKSATELIEGLIERAGLDLEVKVSSIGGKYVNLHLTGGDAEALINNRGAGLDSLQYLANAMLSRKLENGVRLTLDAKEYRSGRATALEKLAKKVAEQVVELKQEAVLDPLPAHERRVIHKALKEMGGVETYSEGEEPFRRVVISPKK